jgi:hypothetical protein
MLSLTQAYLAACALPCGDGTVEKDGECVGAPLESGADADTDSDTDTTADTDTGGDTDTASDTDTGRDTDSGASDARPIAVCTVDSITVEPPFATVLAEGNGSYDPSGGDLTYAWSFVSTPAGSAAGWSSDPNYRDTTFKPDLVGDYVVQLTVTNAEGYASRPCEVLVIAAAGMGLWVEMFWATAGDDMDLHLLEGEGASFTESDCYYANCVDNGVDWGIEGDTSDDPLLALDDILGTGPECTRLGSPADGTYTVMVHDYPGYVYAPSNDVTVNVYYNGLLAWTETRGVVGESEQESFCTIEAPSGVVTSL